MRLLLCTLYFNSYTAGDSGISDSHCAGQFLVISGMLRGPHNIFYKTHEYKRWLILKIGS